MRYLVNASMYQARYRISRLAARSQGKQLFHFLHINKTGGTAIKHAFRGQIPSSQSHIFFHPHRFHLSDIPRGERFTFVLRDPVERFVSGFYCRQRCGKPRYNFPWTPEERAAFETFSSPEALALALGSRDGALQTAAQHAMQFLRHVQTKYSDWFGTEQAFLRRLPDVAHVGWQSSLETTVACLAKLLDCSATIGLPKESSIAHKAPAAIDRKLSDEAIEQLRKWYADDYAFIARCCELFGDFRQVYGRSQDIEYSECAESGDALCDAARS